MATTQAHQFDEYGSLASQCIRCDMSFTLATPHQDWQGFPCANTPYSPARLQSMLNTYLMHLAGIKYTPLVIRR